MGAAKRAGFTLVSLGLLVLAIFLGLVTMISLLFASMSGNYFETLGIGIVTVFVFFLTLYAREKAKD